ncbi:MAG: FUSC family protein, partial [Porticoccus sp.]|nr:FUSC family protein [Porticoccus sp.]MBQ0808242.1 FUSC family protein [Porticoccus sp.]
MVLSYYVAMRFSWLNPSWAAITVAVVSSGDIGQSLGKGVLRAKGTLLAFLAGLFFIAVFPQDRWLMLLSLSIFLFFVTYKMTGKQGQYAWFVTGFVTLMIVTAPVESPADSFEFAAYRALETLTGIGIWTLISVFLWPQSNIDSLQKNGRRLIGAQKQLLDIYRSKLNNQETAVDFHTAHDEAVKILAQFGQSIEAANFESIGVRRQFPYWQQRRESSQSYITILARLDAGLPDLHGINIALIMPTLEPLFTELDRLFTEELIVSEEDMSACPLQPVALNLNKELIGDLDHFQRAALEVLFNDLHRCSGYIKEALRPVDGMGSTPMTMPHRASKSVLSLDPDRVHSALFVVASLWVGMLLWIYLNPPGHIGWMQLLPTVALLSAQMPHIRLPLFKL